MPIIFDLDDTLLDHRPACAAAALRLFLENKRYTEAAGPEAFEDLWFALIEKYYLLWEQGALSLTEHRRQRIRSAFARLPEDTPDNEVDALFARYMEYYEENWRLFPDVIPCLLSLSGIPMAIVTNGEPKQQLLKLEKLGIAHFFSAVTTSGALGIAKPNREIFEACCSSLGCRTKDCSYVGNIYEKDAFAARRAGMYGIWLNRLGEPLPPLTSCISVIYGLDALPEMVRRDTSTGKS